MRCTLDFVHDSDGMINMQMSVISTNAFMLATCSAAALLIE